jgi:hypothetical protein
MRVGVVLVRLAVGGPAGVAHAERAVELLVDELGLEVGQLPLGAHDVDAVAVDDRHARAVIAAVFEFLETAEEHRDDVPRAYISDDSAHDSSPFRTMNAER